MGDNNVEDGDWRRKRTQKEKIVFFVFLRNELSASGAQNQNSLDMIGDGDILIHSQQESQ